MADCVHAAWSRRDASGVLENKEKFFGNRTWQKLSERFVINAITTGFFGLNGSGRQVEKGCFEWNQNPLPYGPLASRYSTFFRNSLAGLSVFTGYDAFKLEWRTIRVGAPAFLAFQLRQPTEECPQSVA
jgi:hypothetical protein